MSKRKTSDFTFKMKSFDEETGTFEGYASTFKGVDLAGDMIMPGAFVRTLNNRNGKALPLLWQHDPYEPIGMVTEAFEDDNGLKFKGKIIMECEASRQKYALLKEGAISGISIGYDTVKSEAVAEGELLINGKACRRKLQEIKLWEISLVTFPCNEDAQVDRLSIKNMDEISGNMADMASSIQSLMTKITELVESNNNLLKAQIPAPLVEDPIPNDGQPPLVDNIQANEDSGTPDPSAPIVDPELPADGDGDGSNGTVEIDVADINACSLADILSIQNALEETTSLSGEIAAMMQ